MELWGAPGAVVEARRGLLRGFGVAAAAFRGPFRTSFGPSRAVLEPSRLFSGRQGRFFDAPGRPESGPGRARERPGGADALPGRSAGPAMPAAAAAQRPAAEHRTDLVPLLPPSSSPVVFPQAVLSHVLPFHLPHAPIVALLPPTAFPAHLPPVPHMSPAPPHVPPLPTSAPSFPWQAQSLPQPPPPSSPPPARLAPMPRARARAASGALPGADAGPSWPTNGRVMNLGPLGGRPPLPPSPGLPGTISGPLAGRKH